jgi:hypothetical protein
LDKRLGLEKLITDHLSDSRHGMNTQFRVADLLRQSVYSRLAGYEDLNDAARLSADPTFRLIGSPTRWDRSAALTSTLHWFETELLTRDENLVGLMALNRDLLAQTEPLGDRVALDMDSSESPVHGQQEGSAYNGHLESVCYHPLFLFNGHGDCLYQEVPDAFGCEPERILRDLAGQIPRERPVLDVGVGQGRNAVYLARRGLTVFGIDPSRVAVDAVNALAQTESLPLAAEQADFNTHVPRVDFWLFADLSTALGGIAGRCNPMKSGRFCDLHARSPRLVGGRLRGSRCWVGGLLGGVHARAPQPTRRPSQPRSVDVFDSSHPTPVAATHGSRST